ncbi:MAG: polysaccharide biosynthesis/export family protein, partial [Prevotella sp.]|nr:polysaccharide biosynthesis/export family protein [Prevotella sp.]
MKRYILSLFLLLCCATIAFSQSSMTDDQIIRFVVKEQKAGSTQQEIAIKLVQKGVTTEQIKRVQKKVERLKKEQGLGTVKSKTLPMDDEVEGRMRKNNGAEKKSTTERLKGERLSKDKSKRPSSADKVLLEEDEAKDIKDELDEFMPDSLDVYDRMVIKKYLKAKEEKEKKDKKKIFGHDLFNNEYLTFEPELNIATPDNYIIGAGDAVNIDIYGASQKTIETTVSPDGYVVVEDYGPIQLGGLTVEQANARLRSQLGPRYSSSQILLTVGQTRSITVNVMGEVKMPGSYTLSAFASVFHALYMAGGPNEIGTLRDIKVYR